MKVEEKGLLWSRWYEKYFIFSSVHILSVNELNTFCNLSRDRIPWATLLQAQRAGQNLWNLHIWSLSAWVVWPKIIFGLWPHQKKIELENNWTIFDTCVPNPFHGHFRQEVGTLNSKAQQVFSVLNSKLSIIVLEPVNNLTGCKHLKSYNIGPL